MAGAVVALVVAAATLGASAQSSADTPRSILTIPYLANAMKPGDLDFAAAECQVDPSDRQMTCRFHQVFVTQAEFDRTACVITTNAYERRFRRDGAVRWISEEPPAGECAVIETTTLDDAGTTHWTMTIGKRTALDSATCRAAVAGDVEVYDWRTVKRPLPCTSIQPGSIER